MPGRISLLIFSVILLKGSIMHANDAHPIVGLNREEKVYLLSLARTTISHYLEPKNCLPPLR